MRDGRWKYIRYLTPDNLEELYDLQNDPEELKNVLGKAEHREVLEKMRKALAGELQRTEAGFSL